MNYHNPELIERLAGDYVVGTMKGAARRRFEGLIAGSIPARRAAQRWEQRLYALSMQLPAVQPPAHVWPKIEQRLNFRELARDTRQIELAPQSAKPGRWWQAIAASAAAVAITLGALLVTRPPEVQVRVEVRPEEAGHTAIVADGAAPLWVLNAYPDAAQLRVTAMRQVALPDNQAFELWMLPDSGAPPVSLGLLPRTGDVVLPLSATASGILARTSTLAISIEPAGGSPTGAPTGPVRYTAPLLHTPARA